jgi:hypothetical protein
MSNYFHLIEINEDRRQIVIYRIYGNGKKELFTTTDLPSATLKDEKNKAFGELARLLGENLLLDSPIARKLLDL